MTRRLFLLNGLAILAVVCNHCTVWGHIALFWWADGVSTPNHEHLGTYPYYTLLLLRTLTIFAVPSFLFISGYFVAYMSRGNRSRLTWTAMKARLKWLLIPYLIWSVAIFIFDLRMDEGLLPLTEYLKRLAFGGATGPYYYIPLLVQLYLLSFVIVPLAKTHWKLLLISTALIQIPWQIMNYRYYLDTPMPGLTWIPYIPVVCFVRTIFFFTFGVVAGIRLRQFTQWLARIKWVLPVVVSVLGVVSVVEANAIYAKTDFENHIGYESIPGSLYGIAVILTVLAFNNVRFPFSKIVDKFGRRTYGIYLMHYTWLIIVANFIRLFIPFVLQYQILFMPISFALGVGAPYLFILFISRSRWQVAYRYLFG